MVNTTATATELLMHAIYPLECLENVSRAPTTQKCALRCLLFTKSYVARP